MLDNNNTTELNNFKRLKSYGLCSQTKTIILYVKNDISGYNILLVNQWVKEEVNRKITEKFKLNNN